MALANIPIIIDPKQVPAQSPENFVDLYELDQQFLPELIPDLVYEFGKGSILGFMKATQTGMKKTYEADHIQHAEAGRLMKTFVGVTISGNDFTFPSAHGLEPDRVVRFFEGGNEHQAIVQTVVSSTVVTLLNDTDTAFPVGPVDISVDFSSRLDKGSEGFTQGTRHGIETRKNYTHIFSHYQDTTNSDLGTTSWVKTDAGPKWFSYEMMRESAKFDNKTELTAVFHKRATDTSASAVAGKTQGMHSVKDIVTARGNIFNDYIQTMDDLRDIAFRLKQQGNCRELNLWANHQQMVFLDAITGGANGNYASGLHYGSFKNSKDMFLNLEFIGVKVAGVQFNFKSWNALDDPSIAAITGSNNGGLSFLGVPCGNTKITMNGKTESSCYMDMMFRKNQYGVRKKMTKFFGHFGTQIKADKSYVDWWSEGTILLAAANNFFVGNADAV